MIVPVGLKDRQIVEDNVRKMLGNSSGDMRKLLFEESIGGNAGKNCAATNFYYDALGRIVYFGNPQDFLREFRNNGYKKGTFVLKLGKDGFRVVQTIISPTSLVAKHNLETTAGEYNSSK